MTKAAGRPLEPLERTLVHQTRHIPYRLYLRKRRGLRIAVTPELVVNVFAPLRAHRAWIESTIQGRAAWIVQTLDRIASCEILSFPNTFDNSTTLRYLGGLYRITVLQGRQHGVEVLLDTLIVTVPDPQDEAAIERSVKRWYRTQAHTQFEASLTRCFKHVVAFRVEKPAVKIRDMRSRWGSCSSVGRISLNLKLVMLQESLIDYVVMHELCHLIHHNHSKRFYALLTECMPDWRKRKAAIERYRMT